MAAEQGYRVEALFSLKGAVIVAPPQPESLGCAEFPMKGVRRSYTVFYGGKRAGTASSAGPDAPVSVQGIALKKGEWALATDGAVPEQNAASPRRSVSEVERAALLTLGRKLFAARGSTEQLLRRIRIEAASSTDLDGDGKRDLVATLAIPETDDPGPVVRALFVVTDGAASSPPSLVHYTVGGGETFSMEYFIDHADLDADGAQEMVTRHVGWEGMEYRVYRKRNGTWKRVFSGGGCVTG